jgi:tetratricopeptide (TPR) repeat protein
MDAAERDKAASSPVEAHAEVADRLACGAVAEAGTALEAALARWPRNPKLLLVKGEVLAKTSPPQAAAHYAALTGDPALAPWVAGRLADLLPLPKATPEEAAALAEAVCAGTVERPLRERILDALLETADDATKSTLIEIAGTKAKIFKYESKLAVARTEAGDIEGAIAVLANARADGRLSLHAAVLYADLLAAVDRLADSIALLEELFAQNPDHADLSRRLTMMLQRARDFDRAAEVFEQAVARWPQDWMLVYRLNRLPVTHARYERILDTLFEGAGDALQSNERLRFHAALAALHGDDPARGFALLEDAKFTPPVSILAVPVQKALKSRDPKTWRASSRLIDDRTKEVQVTRSAKARATVVLTTGITFGNLPLAFIDALFASQDFNVIYLRDFGKRVYLRGVSALGASEDETIAALKDMAADLGAKRLIAMGSSSGGFSAMRVGALMGADIAVSFSGQTALASYLDTTRVSAWNPSFFVKVQMDREGALPFDLLPVLSRPSKTKFLQFYGADDAEDTRQALRLKGLSNVMLIPVRGVGDHFVVDHMIADGSFQALLKELGA